MRRREFITLLGGAAVAWPRGAIAQRPDQVRRIAVLMPFDEGDPEGRRRMEAVREGLQQLGWSEDRNLRIEVRWLGRDPEPHLRDYATELVQLKPEVIFTGSTLTTVALMRATSTIPIIFAAVADPVSSGLVASLARPGGNVTRFANLEPALAEKWLELLKEAAPATSRVSLLYNPETSAATFGFVRSVEAASPSFGVTPVAAPVRTVAEIESALAAADAPRSGVIVMIDLFLFNHREMIVALAARHRLPAIYPSRVWAVSGGLLSYDPELIEAYRRAPIYIDRILRGARPSELPVQEPTKFELVINLKTAKAIGLTVPPALLGRADEVIE